MENLFPTSSQITKQFFTPQAVSAGFFPEVNSCCSRAPPLFQPTAGNEGGSLPPAGQGAPGTLPCCSRLLCFMVSCPWFPCKGKEPAASTGHVTVLAELRPASVPALSPAWSCDLPAPATATGRGICSMMGGWMGVMRGIDEGDGGIGGEGWCWMRYYCQDICSGLQARSEEQDEFFSMYHFLEMGGFMGPSVPRG